MFEYSGNHCGLKLLGNSFQEFDEFPGSNTMATPARIQCSAVWEHLMGKVNEQHCRACIKVTNKITSACANYDS